MLTKNEEAVLRQCRPGDKWGSHWPAYVPINLSAEARVLAGSAAKAFRLALGLEYRP